MHDDAIKQDNCTESDCPSGKRNRFFRGKRMKTEEFTVEQKYMISRRRLISRSVLGWGVVNGLALEGPDRRRGTTPVPGELRVGPGFALDLHGCEIVVVESCTVGSANTFQYLPDASGCKVKPIDDIEPGQYVLAVHYAERRFGDSNLPGWCGVCKPEKNFVCETVVFSLQRVEKCLCGETGCARECRCGGSEACCGSGRGPHECLCQWVTKVTDEGETQLCEWNGYWLNPSAGVDLACVTLAKGDECVPAVFTIDDDCRPRRVIKNNDLLYDLIRGCDLTRIASVSWGEWHRQDKVMPWKEFVDLIGGKKDGDVDEDTPPVRTKLAVTFTAPVRIETVTADCFAFWFTVSSEDTGWFERRAVRIPQVECADRAQGDPPGTTREVTICVDAGWHCEVTRGANKLKQETTTALIEVYGDYILDCHGQAIDANARGLALVDRGGSIEPSGNGSPGGTLLSVFRIPKYQKEPQAAN